MLPTTSKPRLNSQNAQCSSRLMGQARTAPQTAPATTADQGSVSISQLLGANQAVKKSPSRAQPSQPPDSTKATQGSGGAAPSLRGRSSNAVNAGLSVSEL